MSAWKQDTTSKCHKVRLHLKQEEAVNGATCGACAWSKGEVVAVCNEQISHVSLAVVGNGAKLLTALQHCQMGFLRCHVIKAKGSIDYSCRENPLFSSDEGLF